MSGIPGAFNPQNPFASQRGGQYDPGAMQALYLRAQRGDLNARRYLQQIGFLGDQGQDLYATGDTRAGNFLPAVNAWAQQAGSTPYGGQGFRFNPGWITDRGDPQFARAWDQFYQTGGQGDDFTPARNPAANPARDTAAPAAPAGDFAMQNFGHSYQPPQAYWNPWLMAERGQSFGGVYDRNADTVRLDNGRGTGETMTTAETIMRWTQDDLRGGHTLDGQTYADVGAAPLEVVQREYLKNIARMHRDFDRNGLDWNQSGFAALDAGQPQGAAGVRYNGDPSKLGPGPLYAQPDGSASHTPPAGQPGAPAPATYTNPLTGATTNYDPNGGGAYRNAALLDPSNDDLRLSYVLRQFGIDPGRAGLYTGSLARAISPQIEAAMQLNGLFGDVNAMDTAESALQNVGNTLRGPGGFGRLQAQGRAMLGDPRLGGVMGGLGAGQQTNLLQTLLSEAFAGSNAIYNQSRLGQFNQALGPGGEFAIASLNDPGLNDVMGWLRGSEWADLLRGY